MKYTLLLFLMFIHFYCFSEEKEKTDYDFSLFETALHDTSNGRNMLPVLMKKLDSLIQDFKITNDLNNLGQALYYKGIFTFHSYLYSKPYFDSAYFYLNKTNQLEKRLVCNLYYSEIYLSKNNIDSALFFLDEVITHSHDNNPLILPLKAKAISKKSHLLFNNSKSSQAIILLIDQLEYFSSTNCIECLHPILLALAKNYTSLGNKKESDFYFSKLKSLPLSSDPIVNWSKDVFELENLFYHNHSNIMPQLKKVLEKIQKTIYVNEEYGLEFKISKINSYLGNFNESERIINDLLIKCIAANDNAGYSNLVFIKAELLKQQNNFKESEKFYLKAIELKLNQGNSKDLLYCYAGLSNIYTKLYKHKEANQYLMSYLNLKDSLIGNHHIQNIQDYLDQLKSYKETIAFNKIKSENDLQIRTYLFLSILTLLCLVLLIFYYQNKTRNVQFLLLDSKQKLFASQMAPHFLSNIINYIHGLALGDEENKDKSIYYAAKFSKLMRYIIESTSFEYISLNKEIQMMNDYMDLQILMHKSSLNFNVKIQENINMEDYYIPSMLLQPFIENSIKHFPFANKGLYIDMEIFIKNEQLHIIIKDNGIGINKEKIINERESFSINIIKNRVKLINTLHKKSIWFNLDNIIENNQIIGLMVEYKFPIKNIQHENFYS